MALILAIETTTKNCSVALFNKGILLQLKEENSDNYSHAENLTLFINEVLTKENISINKLDAIAVSKGPGSYTGLHWNFYFKRIVLFIRNTFNCNFNFKSNGIRCFGKSKI